MGCTASNIDTDALDKNKAIDGSLQKDKKVLNNTMKLLLLGTGESGKSTIAKQMKIIHLNGFTDEERKLYTNAIHNNVYLSMRSMISAAQSIESKIGALTPELEAKFTHPFISQPISPEFGNEIEKLWKDEGIQAVYKRRNEFQLIDSTSYYLDNLGRITATDYIPNDQDVLRSRVQTTGVIETEFSHKGKKFILVDVGGQRSERKKWIHCFEDITAVLYCVGISEYDQVLYEDNTTNRIHESLKLFHEICQSKWFGQTAIILFLNKSDLFQEKITAGKPITSAFPDYKGPQSYTECAEFIKKKFSAVNDPFTGKPKDIYTHLTCATDTNNVRKVFEAVNSFITNLALQESGLEM